MKLRSPALIRLIAPLMALVAWCWMRTVRVRYWCLDGRPHPTDARLERYIYAFWHGSMMAPLTTPMRVKILISQHADGELIARICRWIGLGVVRGSSTRGGVQAVANMIRTSALTSHLGITPDGPSGPCRQVKVGMIFVASHSGLPIVPCGYGYTHAYEVKSWDRFLIPRPFSRIVGVAAEAIVIPPDLDRDQLESWRQHVEAEFLRVTALAEDWARRIREFGPQAEPPPRRQPATTLAA